MGGERNVAGGAGGGRAGGGGGGRGPSIATGGLNFDTQGLRQFTSAMRAAGAEVKKFWQPFEKAKDNLRAVDAYFDHLEKRVKALKGLSNGALPAGGGPGQPSQPGQGGRSGNGGNSRLPSLPGSINVQGRQPTQTAFRGFLAMRSSGGQQQGGSIPPVSTGAVLAVAGADRLINAGINFANKRLPAAIDMQQAATMASMAQGPGWSRRYRDTVYQQMVRTPGYWSTQDVAQATTMGVQSGLRGAGLQQAVAAGGVFQTLNPNISAEQAMGVSTGLRRASTSNALQRLGVLTTPGGQSRDPRDIFKDVTPRLFGTDKPTPEQLAAAQLDGSRKNLQILDAFGNDQELVDRYLDWLMSNSATGMTITTQSQAERAPGAQTAMGAARRNAGANQLRSSRTDQGQLTAFEREQQLREDANKAMDGLLGKFPGLSKVVGEATQYMSAFSKGVGGFGTAVGGFMMGRMLGLGGPGAGTPGTPGAPTGGGFPSVSPGAIGTAVAGTAISAGYQYLNRNETPHDRLAKTIAPGPSGPGQAWEKKMKSGIHDVGERDAFVDKHAELPGITEGARRRWMMTGIIPWAWRTGGTKDGPIRDDVMAALVEAGLDGAFRVDKADQGQQDAAPPGTGDPLAGWAWRTDRRVDIGDPTSGGTSLRGPGQSQGMDASFLDKLQKMFADNPKLVLNSGFRSRAEQQRLYDLYKAGKGNLAAAPGSSNHEKGLAADIGPPSEYGWLAQNAPKYGLKEPMPDKEPWHWEPTDVVGGGSTTPDAGESAGGTAPSAGGSGGMALGNFSLDPHFSLSSGSLTGASGGSSAPVYTPAAAGGSGTGGTTAGSDTGAAAANVPTSGSVSVEQALRLLKSVGFSGNALQIMAAVGMGESSLNPSAQGDIGLQNATWGPSVGMFQVRTLKADTGKGTDRDINALLGHPDKQAQAAWDISSGGTNFNPWSVFTSGAYKKNMSAVQQVMSQQGIGDPVGAAPSVSMPSMPTVGGGMGIGGPVIHIANAQFTFQIQDGSPGETERAARNFYAALGSRDRVMQAGRG